MPFSVLTALMAFCLVSTITPGPNNLMVMASGVNFGYRRTLPHMVGIALGFGVMVLLVGLGMMQVFEVFPVVRTALTLGCVVYLLYLAWKVANAAPPKGAAQEGARPISFLQAAGFQWVNPKAWSMALTAITLYAPDRAVLSVAIIAACFAAVCLPCLSLWVVVGQQVQRLLRNPARLRAFNWTMAILLVLSLYPVFLN